MGEAVAELRRTYPDMSPSALRFFEREGLIDPLRSPGGHRLFRPSDIERVRQIKIWQARRMSLAEIRARLDAADRLVAPAQLSRAFFEQATRGDLAAAARSVLTADELGVPIGRIFAEVLTPALQEVGERWAHGSLIVGQEHEISEATRDLVAELTLRHASSDPARPAIVAACVAGEHHDLGLRMITGLLRARGLGVHLLGADIAPRYLVEAVQLRRPALVLLSASLPARLEQLEAAIHAMRNQGIHTSVAAGGQACHTHRDAVRAMGAEVPTADDLESLADRIVALVETTPPRI